MVNVELEKWLMSQHPRQVKHMSMGEAETVFHLSDCDSIKSFSPRLPQSCKHKEDTTIPRICGALDLEGCFNGIPHHLVEDTPATSLTLYKLPKYEIIIPGKLLSGVNVTLGEVWLVPYRLSIWDVVPERVATLRLESVTKESKDKNSKNLEVVYFGRFYGEVLHNGKVLPEYCWVTYNTKTFKFSIQSCHENGADIFDRAETFFNVRY